MNSWLYDDYDFNFTDDGCQVCGSFQHPAYLI